MWLSISENLAGREEIAEFDEELYRKLIKQIVVYKDDFVRVIFPNNNSIKIGYRDLWSRKGADMPQTAVKKKVSMIPDKPQYDRSIKLSEKKLRVAAYCRVSTELEEQENSYEAQVEYYTRKIAETDNWKMVGIYADDGKSATNTKKRDDFNAMIKDALDGKIDMILTKSVSRFARNTVDSLLTIRKLKEKNVAVFFEKEGVNT